MYNKLYSRGAGMIKNRFESFNYAVGMFGTSIPINMLKTYATIYYVDRLGLSFRDWSAILLIYTFIDAIDNPIYGILSDRTRTRWGRRRPWLVIAAPLLGLSLVAFFAFPDGIQGGGMFLYALIFYILTGTIDSVINANYGALFPELFQGDAARAVTNAMRQAFQLVAMIISIALTPLVTGKIGFTNTAALYGAAGAAVILYTALTARENAVREDDEKPQVLKSLGDLFRNRKFWLAGIANAFYSAAMALVLAALPFFVKYTLKLDDSQSTVLFASVLIVAIAGVAIWARLVKRFGLVPVWRGALGFLSAAYLPLFFADTLRTAAAASALVGFGFAGVITTMDLIGAKVMDEDQARYRVRREGIISNALGFMNRLSGLFTSAAFLIVFHLFGFESGLNPGARPDEASRFLLTAFPALLMAISFAFSLTVDFPSVRSGASMEE